METITFHSGLFDVTMTADQVRQMYEDVQWLEDAVLSLLNPSVAEKADLPFTNKTYKEQLEYYFSERKHYNQDFITNIFIHK
jgi:hypothetical protein